MYIMTCNLNLILNTTVTFGFHTGFFKNNLLLLLKNWTHLLLGVEPKDTTKPNSRRREDSLLEISKENTEDISQSNFSPTAILERF